MVSRSLTLEFIPMLVLFLLTIPTAARLVAAKPEPPGLEMLDTGQPSIGAA